MQSRLTLILLVGIVYLCGSGVAAQTPDTLTRGPETALQDTVPTPESLISPALPASTVNSSRRLDHSIQFTARDSMVLILNQSGDIGKLIGNAQVRYGDATLTAYEIDMLFGKDELRARGLAADTGMIGRPNFSKGRDSFSGRGLAYNMRTDKGRVVGGRSSVDDGFLLGSVIKSAADSVLFVQGGAYTTCDLQDDPHYSLRASRMKIVDQEWIYTGPIHLRIFNIPLPIWLPFGFLPATEGRRSGPLAPTYGEDERGFYLRDWGWYWAMNDYMDFQTRLGIWSRGSWQVAPLYRYAIRHRFSGQIQLDWTRNRRGEREDPNFSVVNSRSFRWRHDQTINPTSRLSANVDLSSSSYLRTVSDLYDDRVRQTIGSNIQYSKRWPAAGRNMNLSLQHRQQLESGVTNLTLPSLSFSQSTRNPFRRGDRRAGVREQWYERISYSYSASLDNRFDYNPLTPELGQRISWWDALISPERYREATGQDVRFNFRGVHRIPISAPFSIERLPIVNRPFRLNLSPNFNYTENWYLYSQRRSINDTTGVVETESVPGFLSVRQFNTGVGASTEFYGLFPFRVGAFDGFRHTVRPNLSFTYTPDYSSDWWGYYRTYVDRDGREIRYPIVPGVPAGEQRTMSLSISNVFQGRHVSVDTTGERSTRTINLLNLDVSTAYNFAADSLNLGNISLNARTRLFEQFDLNFNSIFSPYAVDAQGRVMNRYQFREPGLRFLRLQSFNFTARTSLRSQRSPVSRPFEQSRAQVGVPMDWMQNAAVLDDLDRGDLTDPFMSRYFNTPVGYADFAIPWSLNLDFTYRYSKSQLTTNRRAIINSRFDFNLTPNWKIQGASGYDITQGEFVTTSISVLRDLHCWQMSFNWMPIGRYQSFSFTIQVKSGHLRDILRLSHPRADIRDRFGSMGFP